MIKALLTIIGIAVAIWAVLLLMVYVVSVLYGVIRRILRECLGIPYSPPSMFDL